MPCPRCRIVLSVLALAAPALPSAGAAHEFSAALVVPADAGLRQAMVAAFLVASRERDGHAEETSEGHLGGIDVQLEVFGPGETAGIAYLGPEVVLAPLAPEDDPALGAGAVVIGAAAVASAPPSTLAPPPGLATGFAARFRDATGTAPGPEATATYVAARLLDTALRVLGGVGDIEALRRSLAP